MTAPQDPEVITGFWRWAEAQPDRIAVVDSAGHTTTAGGLLDRSRRIARSFHELGLRPGDGVAVVLPNVPAFFEVLLAALESGLHFTAVSTHLAAPEIEYVVVDSEAAVLVVDASLGPVASRAVEAAGFPAERRFAVGGLNGFRPYEDLLSPRGDDVLPRSPGAVMPYTSGTTGRPKGVRRPLVEGDPDDVFGTVAAVTSRGFGVPFPGGTHLVCGPLYHAGPYVGALNSLQCGNTLVLMEKWSPEECLRLIEAHRVDSTQMVPTMFHRLLALDPEVRAAHDVSSMRSVFHTGAPCPVEVKQALMDWWGPVVYETYGGTESLGTIATPKRWLRKPGTVGKPVHGVVVRILSEDGDELPAGEIGEIWLETPTGPPEYFKDPEKSASIRRGRMVTLGDIGYLDADGDLFLRDRKIDLIISGGVNIYPAEVEAALLAAPQVADATVFGAPDPEWGEQVVAVVELKPGVAADDTTRSELLAGCRERLAGFKCPRRVDFVEHLPRLPNGKVEKRRLRDLAWADHDAKI